ncbi:MAG: hypothetical protein U0166_11870 [Acidobacteriota bacterium]
MQGRHAFCLVAVVTVLLVPTFVIAAEGTADQILVKAGDGLLGFKIDGSKMILSVLGADKKPVAVNAGAATLFLTFTEDGDKAKVELALQGGVFAAPIPADAHGLTKAVVKVTAGGKTMQGSFEFTVPKPRA